MLEVKVTLVSKTEILCGVIVDTGEVEIKDNKWVSFTRLRLGLIFITLDFTWLSNS
jgi:hypothetical protein